MNAEPLGVLGSQATRKKGFTISCTEYETRQIERRVIFVANVSVPNWLANSLPRVGDYRVITHSATANHTRLPNRIMPSFSNACQLFPRTCYPYEPRLSPDRKKILTTAFVQFSENTRLEKRNVPSNVSNHRRREISNYDPKQSPCPKADPGCCVQVDQWRLG